MTGDSSKDPYARRTVAGARLRRATGTVALVVAFAGVPVESVVAQEPRPEGGHPIDDATVIATCSRCHERDEDGRLSRISWLRKTPEGWQTSLTRMIALHGVRVDPEEARAVVRYLADEQGLAPEELRPGLFEVERRRRDYDYPGDSGVEYTCIQCHSMGRVITQRRTKEEWALLLTTHRALYPLVDFQAFRLAAPEDGQRHPMDEAIDHLAEVFPLETAEWAAWSAAKRSPRLAGEWALSGYEPGKGPIYGSVTIGADPSDADAFTTRSSYVVAESGERVEREGRALVYTGYQWRGRSNVGAESELREVMFVERDLQTIHGRWFGGDYDEFGPDVTLRRVRSDPVLTGVHPPALKRGSVATVTVYGVHLENASADLDFGEGIAVRDVEALGSEAARIRVEVASEARIGRRDLFAGGAVLEGAVAVHDGVDRIEVTPSTGLARTGGANFPKGFETFEAIGYDNGPDGEPDTDDDVPLGRVDVRWTIEEYASVYGDDDVQFVGRILRDGRFEPAPDGPNPDRSGNRNNVGDVWVVATHVAEGGRELTARAQLVVTVPLFIRFDPWRTPGGDGPPLMGAR